LKRIIAAISILLIILIMMFSLTGCISMLIAALTNGDSSETTAEAPQVDHTETYNTEAENAIFAAIPQAPSAEKAPELITAGDNIAEMIYQRAYYEVLSTNGSFCTVQVNAPDMQVIYWDAFEQATAAYSGADADASAQMEAELMELIRIQLESGNYPLRQVTLELEFLNGQPQLTYEFADAMYGGMLTVYQDMIAAYEEG